MKKLFSLLLALMMLISACALAAGSISSDDIAVPDVDISTENTDRGSSIISSSQPEASEPEKAVEAPAGMGMADVLSALKGDEITAYEAVEKTPVDAAASLSDFALTLHVLNAEMPLYSLLEEIAVFVVKAPISEYLGEETMAAALPLLPEGCDASLLALDELYQLTVSGYDAAFGDIEAGFEFVTEYAENTVLLAAAGVLPAEGSEEGILWLPMQAAVSDGKVNIRLSQQALLAANAPETTVAFALLQLDAAI